MSESPNIDGLIERLRKPPVGPVEDMDERLIAANALAALRAALNNALDERDRIRAAFEVSSTETEKQLRAERDSWKENYATVFRVGERYMAERDAALAREKGLRERIEVLSGLLFSKYPIIPPGAAERAIASLVREKLTSGNAIPVERCTIKAYEVAAIDAELAAAPEPKDLNAKT